MSGNIAESGNPTDRKRQVFGHQKTIRFLVMLFSAGAWNCEGFDRFAIRVVKVFIARFSLGCAHAPKLRTGQSVDMPEMLHTPQHKTCFVLANPLMLLVLDPSM